MLAMLRILDTRKYTHRTYVIGEGDDLSVMRARQFEAGLWETCNDTGDQKTRNEMEGSGILVNHENGDEEEKPVTSESQYGTFAIALVPRARRIHQSIFTAPISCLHTLFAAIKLLSRPSLTTSSNPTDLKHSNTSRPGIPDIILANGPATSAIVIFASLILRFFDFSGARGHAKTRIIFIESWARIKTISLSGKCVAWAVDRFVVQWEELKGMLGGRAEWHGVLVV
jgi:beta-1,4-N-acetylglucosaminyltransferase